MNKIKAISEFEELQKDLKEKNINYQEKKVINVGMATCGIASGADDVHKILKDLISEKKLDNVVINSVGCIGECYNEPIVEVITKDVTYRYNKVNETIAKDIINDIKNNTTTGLKKENHVGQIRIALENSGLINPEKIEDYIAKDGYSALVKALFSMTREEVVKVIKDSGLRGRGGAGFPTGIKWEAAMNAPGDIKYIVCNADEGDPGAFMDRAILEGDPHRILEAMIIAGYAIGANTGVIYIRKEYPLAVKKLEIAISQAKEYGFIGEKILGTAFNFDFNINLGAGAFVCGEETSLLNSVQGLRGEPRVKPPFPAQKGLFDKPTNINNVETYANICPIIRNGAQWFSEIGTETSKGTKVFALAGKINNVGLIEVPMGTTLKEIIYTIGGGIKNNKNFKAVQTGGPSGGCIPNSLIDIKIDYESLKASGSMMGSGGMIVMDEDDCMVDIAKYYLDFTVDESCGKCTPCRIGNLRLYEILDKITRGEGEETDLEKLEDLGNIIKDTALCGLGQTSPNPVLSTMKFFNEEYLEHVRDHKCRAGKCTSLNKYMIISEKCIGCSACARVCPVSCIAGEIKKPYVIDQKRCIKCGACFEKCPVNAISKGGN